jgi:hypothetical protein
MITLIKCIQFEDLGMQMPSWWFIHHGVLAVRFNSANKRASKQIKI